MTENLSKLEGNVYDKAIDAVTFSNILLGLQKAYATREEIVREVGGYFLFKEVNPNHLDNQDIFTGRKLLCKILYCDNQNLMEFQGGCLHVYSIDVIEGENI